MDTVPSLAGRTKDQIKAVKAGLKAAKKAGKALKRAVRTARTTAAKASPFERR
jgi:hypothetical protein